MLSVPACLPAWAVPGLPVPLTSSFSFHFSISPFLPPHVHHRVECRIISEYRFYWVQFIECNFSYVYSKSEKVKNYLLHATLLGQRTHTWKWPSAEVWSRTLLIPPSPEHQGFLLYSKLQDSVRRLAYNDSTLTCSCYPTRLRFSN